MQYTQVMYVGLILLKVDRILNLSEGSQWPLSEVLLKERAGLLSTFKKAENRLGFSEIHS